MAANQEILADLEFSQVVEEARPHHNCGVAGACVHSEDIDNTALIVAEMLVHLQHRGPDGAGVAVFGTHDGDTNGYSDIGSVKSVLTRSNLSGLPRGEYGIGQVRYPTQGAVGGLGKAALQPFLRGESKDRRFWTAHNGQFSGGIEGYPSDTIKFGEEVAALFTGGKSLEASVVKVLAEKPDSAYSMVMMSADGVLAIRDPRGLHPLFYGYSDHLDSHLIASETPALSNLGVHTFNRVQPGHMVRLRRGKEPEVEAFVESPRDPSLCALEFEYFARADGLLETTPIYEIRKRTGAILAQKDSDLEADIVIPVPDSARAAAHGYAEASGLPCEEGFIKTTSDRSFLQPTDAERKTLANRKLQIIPSQVAGKRVVLIEDSIVRGNTLHDLVGRLKHFGASEVHLRIALPPIMWECTYGIDIPTRQELIAYRQNGDIEAIRQELGRGDYDGSGTVDSLRYIEEAELRTAIGGRLGANACMKCFTGVQPSENFRYRVPFADRRPAKIGIRA